MNWIRIADLLFCLFAAAILVFVALAWPAESAERIAGKVEFVRDGDTIHVRHRGRIVRIRLHGIDSPELSTPEGRKARDWAVRAWEGKHAVCTPLGRSYNRIVARCQIDGKDIGLQIIKSGHACEWRKYSRGYYRQRETCESRGQR